MTTNLRSYPTRVKAVVKAKEGQIVLDQIHTIDRIRIIRKLDRIQPTVIVEGKDVIQWMLLD